MYIDNSRTHLPPSSLPPAQLYNLILETAALEKAEKGGGDQNMVRGCVSGISYLSSTFLQPKIMHLLVEDNVYRGKRNKVNFYRVRRGSLWCCMAQLLARRLAVRQAQVWF